MTSDASGSPGQSGPDSPVDRIADRFVEDYSALDPLAATIFGIAGHDEEMTDYTPDGFAARAELARRAVADLGAARIGADRERLARDAMTERLGVELELYDSGALSANLNTVASPLQELRMVFDLMPTDTEADWSAISARLAKFPAALDGYAVGLAHDAADGRVSAQRQVRTCAEICARWIGGESFFSGFVSRSPSEGGLRTDLDRGAAAADEALGRFGHFLTEHLLPLAPEADGVGRDRYEPWLRYFTGAELDLDETYEWGWAELARIVAEKEQAADRIVPGGTVTEAMAALDADPARTLHGHEALRQWMQQTADGVVESLGGKHFDIPEPVRRIEALLSPTSGEGIYYTAPSEDFSRPGRMWWSVPEGVEDFTTWRELTTVFHEGVPGHHLQIGQTVYRAELLNRFQRLMLWCAGHGEGWALYAERLMAELGHLDDPGDRLGMLDSQGLRAARVVLDIGMHLELRIPAGTGLHEGERWSAELGMDFLRRHVDMEDQLRIDELNRYLGWPGQAPSYKVGERSWLQARAAAEARHGADFDLRAFHTAALNLGSMGLGALGVELARL